MYNMYKPTSTSPGKRAPINISPALVEFTPNSDGIVKLPVASLYIFFLAISAMSTALDN